MLLIKILIKLNNVLYKSRTSLQFAFRFSVALVLKYDRMKVLEAIINQQLRREVIIVRRHCKNR